MVQCYDNLQLKASAINSIKVKIIQFPSLSCRGSITSGAYI